MQTQPIISFIISYITTIHQKQNHTTLMRAGPLLSTISCNTLIVKALSPLLP